MPLWRGGGEMFMRESHNPTHAAHFGFADADTVHRRNDEDNGEGAESQCLSDKQL